MLLGGKILISKISTYFHIDYLFNLYLVFIMKFFFQVFITYNINIIRGFRIYTIYLILSELKRIIY